MPLETRVYDLETTIQDLESEREETAATVAMSDPDSNAVQQLDEKGQRLDRYLSGLWWYRDEYDAESITLGALTNGERHRVRDKADQIGQTPAARQNVYVALGTIDAAYVEHDSDAINESDFEETIQTVADLHPAFVDWVENEITNLGRMDGDTGKSFSELVLAKQLQANSQETNG